MILKENKYTAFRQGLATEIKTPSIKLGAGTNYLRLKNDIHELNNSTEMSIYNIFKIDTLNSQFNRILVRGTNANTWIQIIVVVNDLYIDVYGVNVGRYVFNDLISEGKEYELLVNFDNAKVSDKVSINLNGGEFTASSKPSPEPTELANQSTVFDIGSSTSLLATNGGVKAVKVWDSVLTLDQARNNAVAPLVDISFDSVNNNTQFDSSANENHAVGVGTITWEYTNTGTSKMNELGYSLYTKDSNPNIYVPYDLTGSPITVVIGTDIPTGYIKSKDVAGSDAYHNLADSIISFNYWGGDNSRLLIFDRSNTTIHNATSRASVYYNDQNIRTVSDYHITEISDLTLLNSYFNTAYQNRLFPKITGNNLVEFLNYATKKEGADLINVLTYLGD